MSFIDPDQREAMAKSAQELRARCAKQGQHTFVGSGDRCIVCSAVNPEAMKPRVTLKADVYRAVHDPQRNTVTIEKSSTDSLGSERWDAVKTLSSIQSRSEESHWPIFVLLSKGVKP